MKTQYILAFLLSLTFTMTAQDREADSLILVDIYNSLNGPNWSNPENWLTDAPLEQWEGISISEDRVSTLSFINQNPAGPFPVQVLGLDKLRTLEFRGGANVTGNIPTDLVQLTQLSRFSVSDCGLSGEVPNIFTQFDNLKYLILSNNNFEGSLPDIPDGMVLFYAQRNNFSGSIPSSWENVLLGIVDISNNDLTGTLDVFGSWSVLSRLDVSNNNWEEGPLPMWLDTLNNLNSFKCSNCNLVGDIPSGFDLRDNLVHEQLILDGNSLSGDVAALFIGPNSAKKLYLRVNGNQFSGNFPAHLIHSASSVDIRSNNFTSFTSFPEDVEFNGRFSTEYNKFNYEALEPLLPLIEQDGGLEVRYSIMQKTLTPDTLLITESTTLTMLAGDLHPNTTYEWIGPTVQGLTEPMVDIVIDEFSNGGTFRCLMANENYPDLSLLRNDVIVMVDFSTAISNEVILDVKVYPNPTQDHLVIELAEQSQSGTYTIVRSDGGRVTSGSINRNQNITIQNLETGTYFLEVQAEGKYYSQIIIKL